MHLPKDFKPPGVSDRLRFQSTAQMAMADTGSKYGTLESSEERQRKLMERKIGNTKTSIHFGSDRLGYKTTARENDNYNRSVITVPAGGEGGEAMTPHDMKMKGQKVNWDFGDAPERSWAQASTLNDPTGPNFSSYRGILNEDVRSAIKMSSLALGSDVCDYKTATQAGMHLNANDIDYAGDYARAKAMKKALTSSSLDLSSDAKRGPEDYQSTATMTMAYDPVKARDAQGVMNAAMKLDLRAQHFQLGYSQDSLYLTNEKERQARLERSMDLRRQEILEEAGGELEHPDAVIVQKSREKAKSMKQMLSKSSVIIGDNPDYM